MLRTPTKRHGPITFGCSCGPDVYPFQLFCCEECQCGECGTWYRRTGDGRLTTSDRYLRTGEYAEPHSHAVNVEWPA